MENENIGVDHIAYRIEKAPSIKSNGGSETREDPKMETSLRYGKQNSISEDLHGNDWFVIFCTLVASLGALNFGFAIGFTSPTLDTMTVDLNLSVTQASIFSAIINVGAMAGAVSGGGIADAYGRRVSLLIAALLFTIGWGLIASGQEIFQLCTGRVLTGLATGIVSFAVPVYIAEISPGRLRGRLGAVNQLGLTVGILLVYTLGVFTTWRKLAIIGIYPSVLLLLGLLVVTESPRWAAKRGTTEDLVRSLTSLRGPGANISHELNEIQLAVEEGHLQPKAQLSDLLHPDLRQPLIIGVGLMVMQQFSGVNAVLFYSGQIFSALGFENPNYPGIFMQTVQVATTVVTTSLMDKAGRKPLLIISSSLMAVGAVTLGMSFKLQAEETFIAFSEVLAFVSLVIYILGFSLGLGAVPWVIMSEIFPAHIRDMAGSLAVLINWLCCFIVTLTFEDLLEWSSVYSFYLFGGECFLIVLFVTFFLPETKGRSLEEIEAFFRSSQEIELA